MSGNGAGMSTRNTKKAARKNRLILPIEYFEVGVGVTKSPSLATHIEDGILLPIDGTIEVCDCAEKFRRTSTHSAPSR